MKTILAAGLVLLSTVAAQAAPCVQTYEEALANLYDNYQEEPVMTGLSAAGNFVTVTASATGSWTMIETVPNGFTCMIADGQNYQEVALLPNI